MRLRLYNFKCYEAEEFTIPDRGLVLISAPSGRGKSTILEGFLFALFGTGKKLPTWGKRSCKVELEYQGLFVTRTKVPNRLVVKRGSDEYEDAAAQAVIDQVFGEVFQTTSFVDNHNLHKSFILLSPTDKLLFLEKFSLRENDLIEIKGRTKDKIKRCQQDLISAQSRLQTAEEILKTIDPPESVPFPLKRIRGAPEEKLVRNEEIRFKNTKVYISRGEKRLKIWEGTIKKIDLLEVRENQLSEITAEFSQQIEELAEKQGALDCLDDDELTRLEGRLEGMTKNREGASLGAKITDLARRIKEGETRERDELKKGIVDLKKRITAEPKKLENLLGVLQQNRMKAADHEKISKGLREYQDTSEEDLESFKQELDRNQKDLFQKKSALQKIKLSQEALKCPRCNSTLMLEYDSEQKPILTRVAVDPSQISGNVKKLEGEIDQLSAKDGFLQRTVVEESKRVREKGELAEKLKDLDEFFRRQEIESVNLKKIDEQIQTNTNLLNATNTSLDQLQNMEERLRNEKFSSTIAALGVELEETKQKYGELNPNLSVEVKENEKELREKFTQQKLLCQEYDMLEEQLSSLRARLSSKEADLNKIRKDLGEPGRKESSRAEKEKLEAELGALKEALAGHQANLEKIKAYQEYQKQKEKHDALVGKVQKMAQEELEAGKRLKAATLLKQKIMESESIAIHNVIDNINAYAAGYLDLFFPDDPINVALLPFKEAKNKKSEKPQINLQIIYKNEDCDVTSLSGGELSRLVLAFTLALSEMFNTPALLLDECTASLDQGNTQNVFDSIRRSFGEKLVLVIAHQVVEGSYDYVIQL